MQKKSISLFFNFRQHFSSKILSKKAAYEILGLHINAHPNEIKAAYIKCSKQFHPDVSEEKNAEEIFKGINEAYSTLKKHNMVDEDYFSSRSNRRSNYNFEDELDFESLKKINLKKDGGTNTHNSKIHQLKKESGQGIGSFRKNGEDNATLKSRMNAFLKVAQ